MEPVLRVATPARPGSAWQDAEQRAQDTGHLGKKGLYGIDIFITITNWTNYILHNLSSLFPLWIRTNRIRARKGEQQTQSGRLKTKRSVTTRKGKTNVFEKKARYYVTHCTEDSRDQPNMFFLFSLFFVSLCSWNYQTLAECFKELSKNVKVRALHPLKKIRKDVFHGGVV